MDRIRIRRVSRYFVGEESFSRSFGSVLVFNDGIIYLYISCTPENYHSATSNQCVKHKDAPQGEKNKRCTWQVYVNEGSVVFCFLFYFFFFWESSIHEFWTTAVVTLAELSNFYRRLFTGWMVTYLNKLTETGRGSWKVRVVNEIYRRGSGLACIVKKNSMHSQWMTVKRSNNNVLSFLSFPPCPSFRSFAEIERDVSLIGSANVSPLLEQRSFFIRSLWEVVPTFY